MTKFIPTMALIVFASTVTALAAPACMNSSEEITPKNKICHYSCPGTKFTKTVPLNQPCPKTATQ